ncbi:hypothetical protein DITRI_Ditri20bG0137800 [Diplodiscus trichospermus]
MKPRHADMFLDKCKRMLFFFIFFGGRGGGGPTNLGLVVGGEFLRNVPLLVVATNETTPVRSRRKKTLAELKEEMSSHSKENNSLKNELEMVKLKFENLRTTNETLRRKLKFEKERAMGESSKRIKLDYESNLGTETAMAFVESKNGISDLTQQREVGCHPASVVCNENDTCMRSESSKAEDVAGCETSFVLPDLNVPIEDDSGCQVLHGIS